MDRIVKDVNDHCAATGTSRSQLLRNAGVSRGAWAGWVKGGGVTRESLIRLDDAMREDRSRVMARMARIKAELGAV